MAPLADGWNLALHTDVLHDAVFEEDGFLYVVGRTDKQRHADFIVALAVYLHTSGPVTTARHRPGPPATATATATDSDTATATATATATETPTHHPPPARRRPHRRPQAAIFATYGWPGSHLKKHASHYQKAWKMLMLIWDAQSPLAKQLKAVLLTEEWPKAENGAVPQWPLDLPSYDSDGGVNARYKKWLNRAASLSTAMASPWLISLCCGMWRHAVLKHLPQVKKAEEWRDASIDWQALSDDEIVRRGGDPAFLKALWKAQPDDANARQVCFEVARASQRTGRKGDKETTRESFGATNAIKNESGVLVGGNEQAVVSFNGVTEQSWDLARTVCSALDSGVLAARVLSIAHAEVLPKIAASLTLRGGRRAAVDV